jgi:hypothetical protein
MKARALVNDNPPFPDPSPDVSFEDEDVPVDPSDPDTPPAQKTLGNA